MTMSQIVLNLMAGVLAGGVYHAGLWMTVTRLAYSERPMVLLAGSALVRMLLLLGGFVLVSFLEWQNLVACMAGFVAVRFGTMILVRPRKTRYCS